jgi:AraC-like DNA-binding protein
MKRRRKETKTIPAEIVAEAAEPAFQRIRACIAKAPPMYKDLLADMAQHLLDPDVKMSHLWAARRLDPSGHTGRLGGLLGAPPWSFIRALRVDVAARLLADQRIADVSGTQTALEAGFKSYNALNERFKDCSGGITATSYRTAQRNATSTTTGMALGQASQHAK